MRYMTGIAQVEIRRRHIDLGPQRSRAIRKFARPHALEQVQIFFDGAVAIRALLARLGQRSALLAKLVGAIRSQTYALPALISCTAHS